MLLLGQAKTDSDGDKTRKHRGTARNCRSVRGSDSF